MTQKYNILKNWIEGMILKHGIFPDIVLWWWCFNNSFLSGLTFSQPTQKAAWNTSSKAISVIALYLLYIQFIMKGYRVRSIGELWISNREPLYLHNIVEQSEEKIWKMDTFIRNLLNALLIIMLFCFGCNVLFSGYDNYVQIW